MQSSKTNVIYYLKDRVKDTRTNIEGTVYGLNTLGVEGIRVKLDNGKKTVYFKHLHQYLIKI